MEKSNGVCHPFLAEDDIVGYVPFEFIYIYIFIYMSKSSTFSIANALLCICIHMYPMINGEVLGASPVFGTQIMLGLEERLRVKCLLT